MTKTIYEIRAVDRDYDGSAQEELEAIEDFTVLETYDLEHDADLFCKGYYKCQYYTDYAPTIFIYKKIINDDTFNNVDEAKLKRYQEWNDIYNQPIVGEVKKEKKPVDIETIKNLIKNVDFDRVPCAKLTCECIPNYLFDAESSAVLIMATQYLVWNYYRQNYTIDLSLVFAYGVKKYKNFGNFLIAYKLGDFHQAYLRHFKAWLEGEEIDADSKIHHLLLMLSNAHIIEEFNTYENK